MRALVIADPRRDLDQNWRGSSKHVDFSIFDPLLDYFSVKTALFVMVQWYRTWPWAAVSHAVRGRARTCTETDTGMDPVLVGYRHGPSISRIPAWTQCN